MVSFQTKNPNLSKGPHLDGKMLKYFMAIWNILRLFGIFYDHLVHFFRFWYHVPRKIWQPWCKERSPKPRHARRANRQWLTSRTKLGRTTCFRTKTVRLKIDGRSHFLPFSEKWKSFRIDFQSAQIK
jgi:hypothetical protein